MHFAPHARPARRLGRRLIPLVAALAVALVIPAGALAGGFTAHLRISTHEPKVGLQPITVTAVRGSQKLSGTVSYQFLYQGQLVKSEPGGHFTNGVYRDKLDWPKAAIGRTISLHVIVRTRFGTDVLPWWIKVYP